MQVVESLTQVAVSAANAAIGMATLKSQAAMAGIGMLQNVSGTTPGGGAPQQGGGQGGGQGGAPANPNSTLPSKASITDRAALELPKALTLANALQLLVSGGENNTPDWDRIRGKVS